jgi:hypothetical protein
MTNDNVKKIDQPPNEQRAQAFIVPVPIFLQMVELIRGNCCHRDADPIVQQIGQLAPQEVTVRRD